MKLVLCLAFILCIKVQLGKSELLSRHKCLGLAFCGEGPPKFDFEEYAKPELNEEAGSHKYHYRLNTDIVDYLCNYALAMSTCIQNSYYSSLCDPEIIGIFDAFTRIVGSACGDYRTDMIEMITCFNDKDIQKQLGKCVENFEEPTTTETCGLAIEGFFDQCTTELRLCNPASVSKMQKFFTDSREDICFLTNL